MPRSPLGSGARSASCCSGAAATTQTLPSISPAACPLALTPMPSSRRGEAGPDPHLLFTALLTRNCAWAAQLLLGSQAQQLSHEGPAGFSSLHAAVVGGCSDQLLALVAAGRSWPCLSPCLPKWQCLSLPLPALPLLPLMLHPTIQVQAPS